MKIALHSLTLISITLASPLGTLERSNRPAAFFLAGDSTTAAPSGSGGGWGNGFLSTLVNGAIGTNFGHNGATTVSFVSGGDWAKVLASVTNYKPTYSPFVTIQVNCISRILLPTKGPSFVPGTKNYIGGWKSFANTSQFGHNDQKATANISIPEFSTNLKKMAQDVLTAGGTPVLVTSLSRRKYASTGLIEPDLTDVVNAALSVASANSFPFIDLNKASMAYLNAIGEADARLYDRVAGDATHLDAAGDMLFGNMVSWLLGGSRVGTQVEGFLSPNVTIVDDIENGKFILPVNTTVA